MTLRRKWEEKFFRGLSGLITLVIVLTLVHLIWSIIAKGASSLSWQMVSEAPKGTFYFGGEGGGFLMRLQDRSTSQSALHYLLLSSVFRLLYS